MADGRTILGDHRGDFARVTFDPLLRFTQVLSNQGRVSLEADWNEQGAIMLHLLRRLACDLKGRAWRSKGGFALSWTADDKVQLSKGAFYNNGVACEQAATEELADDYWDDAPPVNGDPSLFFVEAWERHITANEVPALREIALLGPETASRAQLVWRLRCWTRAALEQKLQNLRIALALHNAPGSEPLATVDAALAQVATAAFQNNTAPDNLLSVLDALSLAKPRLSARARTTVIQDDPCSIAPDAEYRGRENQLYRVEIHDPGLAGAKATFKFSRENSSVAFPILATATSGAQTRVTVTHLGADARLGLCAGDWVEYVDDDIAMNWGSTPLMRVTAVDRVTMSVTLEAPGVPLQLDKHPVLRRWDQQGGPIQVLEGDTRWIELEDGVEVRFETGGVYEVGDYWLIPARVATGDVEWPKDGNEPAACLPHGVKRYLAPLAINNPADPTNPASVANIVMLAPD